MSFSSRRSSCGSYSLSSGTLPRSRTNLGRFFVPQIFVALLLELSICLALLNSYYGILTNVQINIFCNWKSSRISFHHRCVHSRSPSIHHFAIRLHRPKAARLGLILTQACPRLFVSVDRSRLSFIFLLRCVSLLCYLSLPSFAVISIA